jgi:hypothetical protein
LELFALLHDRLSVTVMLFMVVLGSWGIVAYLRGGSLSGSYAGALAIGEALIVVAMLATGARPPSATHYLYGITAILVLPFAWSYLRSRSPRQALLIYSLIAMFIFGLAVRGMITGR